MYLLCYKFICIKLYDNTLMKQLNVQKSCKHCTLTHWREIEMLTKRNEYSNDGF